MELERLPFESDTHVHTNLSSCAPRTTFPESYNEEIVKSGTKLIGFSNHMWDKAALSSAPWYENQDVDHVLEIKDQLSQMQEGVRVKIGCECEFPGTLALTKERASSFDYVLITASHFHIKGVCAGCEPKDALDARNLLIERFSLASKADTFGIPSMICHPFFPLGWNKERSEIVKSIHDDEFASLLICAKENGKGIEIHHASIFSGDDKDSNGFDKGAVRYLSIARDVGCLFSFGSDLHKPEEFTEKNKALRNFAHTLGIDESRMAFVRKSE